MESKWRWNAWYFYPGVFHNFTLLARMNLDGVDWYLSNEPAFFPGYHHVFFRYPGTDLVELVGDLQDVTGHPRFPYGHSVEPD